MMALLLTTAKEDMMVRMVYHVPMHSAPLGSGLRDTYRTPEQPDILRLRGEGSIPISTWWVSTTPSERLETLQRKKAR